MKAAINKILENKNNIGLDFVVHIRNEKELSDLIDILMKHNFCVQLSFEFSPEQIDLWMKDIAKEDGYDLCFRIRNRENDKCVAYNLDNELRQQYRQAVDDLRVAFKKTCLYRFCEEVVKRLSKILR